MTELFRIIRNEKVIRNEKGGGWLFTLALVMILVIAIMTPTMLNLISNRNLTDIKIEEENMVNQLAIGGIETFIAYLKDYHSTKGLRVNYFKSYPGWGETIINTPGGKQITYKLSLENTSIQSVTARVAPYILVLKASAERPFAYEKIIKYKVVIQDKNPLLDPNRANEDKFILPVSREELEEFNEFFQQLIPNDELITKEFTDFEDLQEYIDNLSSNSIPSELIVKITGDNHGNRDISIKDNLDFTKIPTLIIYVDGDIKTNGNGDISLNGMLLVNGDFSGGASSIRMDNLIVNGELSNVGGVVQSTVAILDLKNNVGGNDRGDEDRDDDDDRDKDRGVGNEELIIGLNPSPEYNYLNESASSGWGIERTN